MFGGDDDDDFMPANNSKLATLFSSKSGGEGNTSLTYTAPKQPKRASSSKTDSRTSTKTSTTSGSITVSSTTQPSTSNKLGIIIVKAVNTYKREDGSYNLQGKLGAAVLGNATVCAYQLLLYKGKQHHITSTKITPNFQYTVQPNNYGTFYDDQKQNWSLHFDHDEDAEEFAKEIGLARGNSQGGDGGIQDVLTQDLCTGEGLPANVGDSMDIFYSVRLLTECKLGQLVETNLQADKPQRVKIKKNVWEEGLIGATKGAKRIILLPPSLVGPWKQEVPSASSLVVEVQVSRVKQGKSSLADSGESTDETSIKARGASIADALTASPKTHKANIISRMARMGQATLPLKGAVTCNPSDSEDSEEEATSPKPAMIFKPASKVQSVKTPPKPASPPENHLGGHSNMSMPPQQMSVYHSHPVWQQQSQPYTVGPYGISQLDRQMYPLVPNQGISSHQLLAAPSGTPPGMPSSDSHFSILFSETRTHNTEVRMGMAKVAEKVDQVLAKLDSASQALRPCVSTALLDSTSLLASIQRLVTENEQLKSELVDKGNKIDVQNDRIYQLLNTNHKYLEQSTTSSSDQRNHEALVVELQLDKTRLAEELGKAREEAKATSAWWENYKRETTDAMVQQQEELVKTKSVVVEQDAAIQGLTDRLKTASEAQDSHEKTIAMLTRSLLETQESNVELKAGLSEMTDRLNLQRLETDEAIKKLAAEYSAQLKARETSHISSAEVVQKPSEPFNYKLVVEEVKKVMNVVYKSLMREFISGENYQGESIKETLVVTIRDITCQMIEKETFATLVTVKSQTVNPSAGQNQEGKLLAAPAIGDTCKAATVASSESQSDTGRTSKHPETYLKDRGVPPGSSGTPKELPSVSSEPCSKPVVNSPPSNETSRTETGSSTSGINQTRRDATVVPPEPHSNAADGPKDLGTSPSLPGYMGGNAGDIPTVPLAKLAGETDLSVKLASTDGEAMLEASNNLRVTSDLCVPGTSQTPNVLDGNRCDSMSAVTPNSVTRPAMVSTTTDALKVDHQQPSTNDEEVVRESSLERISWRSEPPPLFDDDEDEDDWLS